MKPLASAIQHSPPFVHAMSAGQGIVRIERGENGSSYAATAESRSPLRLLTPGNCGGHAAWVFTSTFGGGLLAGDSIDIQATLQPGSTAVLATQASTKVFRSPEGRRSAQSLRLDIADDAAALVLPDQLTCFTDAIYEGHTQAALSKSASLVLVDWLTSGRRARGERWAFRRYVSRLDVSVEGRLVFKDATCLDQVHGPVGDRARMGRCDCFGLVLALGPRFAAMAGEWLQWCSQQPIDARAGVYFSISPVADGAVIRVAAQQTQDVGRWIRERLRPIITIVGADPWARKW